MVPASTKFSSDGAPVCALVGDLEWRVPLGGIPERAGRFVDSRGDSRHKLTAEQLASSRLPHSVSQPVGVTVAPLPPPKETDDVARTDMEAPQAQEQPNICTTESPGCDAANTLK